MTIPETFQIALQHHQAGRLSEAEALYRQILAAQPNHMDVLLRLGVVAHQTGRNDLAADWMRRAIRIDPANAAAHSNLGEACRELGQLEEAISEFHRAIELTPHLPGTHNNLGNALRESGRLDEAIAAYRRAIELKPGYIKAYINLGNTLRERGRLPEAIAACRCAIQLQPDSAEVHNNLGNALKDHGELSEAIASYRQALTLMPDYAEIHSNLGNALRENGQIDEAIAELSLALRIKPHLPETHLNLGNALRDRGQLDEGVAAYRRAIDLKAGYAEAHSNLGGALKDRGEWDAAVDAFRHSVALNPGSAGLHSNLIYTLHFYPACTPAQIREEHERWNRRYAESSRSFLQAHTNDRDPERRLRVGYVSPDFTSHVVGRNLLPLLRCHDHLRFEIVCYSGVVRPGKATEEFRRRAHHWRSAAGLSDEALTTMIRQDGVDILVDLTQHMAGNRLTAFAQKPAPVQVSFAGYPDSAGLDAIPHRISDRHLEGASADEKWAKKERVHCIDSFWCYDPCNAGTEINPLPALQENGVTFGCLNNFSKVNEAVLELWARALTRVRKSRLVLRSPEGTCRQRIREFLQREGVSADRLEFVESRPRREYLALYHRLDIALDTFPYNGHTTSLDALWMGVPVVTLAGNAPVSRAGLSQLTNLGLPELVARSEEEYIAIAERFAANLRGLAELRATLRPRMESSPLMDAPRFARQIERAYREMWQAWVRQQDAGPRAQ